MSLGGEPGLVAPARPAWPNARACPLRVIHAMPPGPVVRRWRPGMGLGLMAADAVAVAALAGTAVRGDASAWLIVLAALALVGPRAAAGVHRYRLRLSFSADLSRSVTALATTFGIVATVLVVSGAESEQLVAAAVALIAAWLVAEAGRATAIVATRVLRVRFGRGSETLVVGSGRVGRDLVANMLSHPGFGLRPVVIVDPTPKDTSVAGVPLLTVGLEEALEAHRPDTVVLAFTEQPESALVDAAIVAQRQGCRVLVVPRMFELHIDGPHVERLRGYPLVRLAADPTLRPSWRVKRVLDVLLSLLAMVLATPVMLVCAVAVLVESGRPVLFVQQRTGRDGHPFELYKFRSMRPLDEHEAQTRWTVAGDDRIGPVGRVLRRTSLDELPQLWNIVRGDMSLVGPRPERMGLALRFAEEHDRYWARHRVPAGLTGLAQVNGLRGDTSIADRARYDNYYINTWSLALDVAILVLTARELFRRGEH